MTRTAWLNYLMKITSDKTTPHPSKQANWLKFCHGCGRDISGTAKGVIFCGARCQQIRSTARSTLVRAAQRAPDA
jgi:rRNA maturation endonuclease Nob1